MISEPLVDARCNLRSMALSLMAAASNSIQFSSSWSNSHWSPGLLAVTAVAPLPPIGSHRCTERRPGASPWISIGLNSLQLELVHQLKLVQLNLSNVDVISLTYSVGIF